MTNMKIIFIVIVIIHSRFVLIIIIIIPNLIQIYTALWFTVLYIYLLYFGYNGTKWMELNNQMD